MAQLTFTWTPQPSYAAEDFIVSSSNAKASRFLESWPDGAFAASLISGPASCGKTHLALNWAARNDACIIHRDRLGKDESGALWQGHRHALLEDMHSVTDENALFHLLRHAETQKVFILLTSRKNTHELPFTLADLQSRLRALQSAEILPPDDDLLQQFLFKCFAERQLRVKPDVMAYLVRRMDRSFLAAQSLAAAVEQRALESGKQITIPLVKTLFE